MGKYIYIDKGVKSCLMCFVCVVQISGFLELNRHLFSWMHVYGYEAKRFFQKKKKKHLACFDIFSQSLKLNSDMKQVKYLNMLGCYIEFF